MSDKSKKVTITNSGQFTGNVDSPGAVVSVGGMQQNVQLEAKRVAEEFTDDAVVRQIVADDSVEVPAKTTRLADRLRSAAGIGFDVALVAAQHILRANGLLPPTS